MSRTLAEFTAHYHGERNHQGKGNKLLFPDASNKTEQCGPAVECASGSEDCSSSMPALHEFFDHMGTR
jgi:hypothetical protein